VTRRPLAEFAFEGLTGTGIEGNIRVEPMDRACVLTRALPVGRHGMARVDRHWQSRSGSGARGPLTLRLAGTPERWISREATNKFGTT
jgi:hypothetical protein